MKASLRFEILRRDNWTCGYCGRHAPEVRLQVDHIKSRANGGTDDPANLITSCSDCNAGKGSAPLGSVPASASEVAHREALTAKRASHIRARWQERSRVIPPDQSTVERFLRQLEFEDVLEAAEAATRPWEIRDREAYFCACCLKKIRSRSQQRA